MASLDGAPLITVSIRLTRDTEPVGSHVQSDGSLGCTELPLVSFSSFSSFCSDGAGSFPPLTGAHCQECRQYDKVFNTGHDRTSLWWEKKRYIP